jgi:hypothetical protein
MTIGLKQFLAAATNQSTENIFPRLEESEYYIFIDFKREELIQTSKMNVYRGSLFSHQELAVATFLGKPVIAFQEEGLKRRDGILGFIQANCIPFSERQSLPERIKEEVKKAKWSPTWQNKLIMQRQYKQYEEAVSPSLGISRKARWYHIRVQNDHNKKTAVDCVAYLKSYKKIKIDKQKNVTAGKTIQMEPVEFKWKGVNIKEVLIQPGDWRLFDAFYVFQDSQHIVHLAANHFLIDFQGYLEQYTLEGPGDFELTYIIYSANFPHVESTFMLHIGNRYDEITFKKKVKNK